MSDAEALREAIANCDREPIHTPGCVQTYGALIATDPQLETVLFASGTTGDHLGRPADGLLGTPVRSLLDIETLHNLRNALSRTTAQSQREIIGNRSFAGCLCELSVHAKGDRAIVEFLPHPEDAERITAPLARTRTMLAQAVGCDDVQEILEYATHQLRGLTGHDRVKAYRFLPDGAGEVVAEARTPKVEAYLGLRFPASDIPPRARELYASTPIRVIADVDAADAPLLSVREAAAPLDLSLAMLRGTSPVHLRYMKNMGVRSTLTLPIVVNGEMWGLFAAHHMTPMRPNPTMLTTAELVGQMLSMIIQHAIQRRQERHLQNAIGIATKLVAVDDSELSVSAYWERSSKVLAQSIPCDGLLYCVGRQQQAFGHCPEPAARRAIQELTRSAEGKVSFFDDLPARLPDVRLGDTAGALAITLREHPRIELLFVRRAVDRQVRWAGEPNKGLERTERGFEINPRNSFAQYNQSLVGRCDEWTGDDLDVARTLQFVLSEAVDTQEKLKDTRHRLGFLVRELNHRVRNILTLVQSLARQSREGVTSIESYTEALEQRIVALAGAHNLLTGDEMRGTSLDRITALELRPYQKAEGHRVTLVGPKVVLRADVVPVIALVLHELTSNAAKYGALSTPVGHVLLEWREQNRGLHLRWQESDGPPVEPPPREGFGRSIIENAIPFEFDGTAELTFAPAGVTAAFWLPAPLFETEVDEPLAEATPDEETPREEQPRPIDGTTRRALVVEDNFVIAQELRQALARLGFDTVDTASNTKRALRQIDKHQYSFCLLDIDLNGETSHDVAKKLTQLQIQFCFITGYGSEGYKICEGFDVTVLTKPISLSELQALLPNGDG